MRSRSVCTAAVLLAFSVTGFAQDKAVSEECENDADCAIGNCVQLKADDGARKVCLYCRGSDYEGYWSEVQTKCKDLGDIRRYADLEAELRKQPNARGEFSLPYLIQRREINAACLTARSTRENNCWKEKIDAGHQDEIDTLDKLLNFADQMIKEGRQNGLAYTVDRQTFDELEDDEQGNCEQLSDDFKWFSDIEDTEKLDCSKLESVIDRAIDCREVRQSIVDVFKDGASANRKDALREAEAAESEAKRTLDLKKSNSLCE